MNLLKTLLFTSAVFLIACSPSAPAPSVEQASPTPVLADLLGIRLNEALDVPHCKTGRNGFYLMANEQPATPCWLSSSWSLEPIKRKPPSEVQDDGFTLRFNDKQVPPGADNDVSIAIWNGRVHRIQINMNKYHSSAETRDMLARKFGLPNAPESRRDTWHWATDSEEAIYLGKSPDPGEASVILTTKSFYAHEEAERKSRSANSF